MDDAWPGPAFFAAGDLTENAERNWFIGIRTPWSLSSEAVWKDSSVAGGRAFKAAALASLLGLLFPSMAIFFILAPVLAAALYATAYSYFRFKRERSARA